MSDEREHRSRRMWRALEPVHLVTYFAREPVGMCAELGTKGFWMSYFAQRAAPMGAIPPDVVTALFYNFSRRLVARAVPDVWAVAAPQRFLEIRLAGVGAALERLVGAELLASPSVAEAAQLAREAAEAAPTAGRPLAAANIALEWPEEPHLALWHAQTVLREQRGDGHVVALQAAGLDPTETLVLFAADHGMDPTWLRERRGWTEPEWDDAVRRLTERGLLAGAALTPAGKALRADVEATTDALAAAPWDALGEQRSERLVELVAPIVSAIVAAGEVPVVNPVGIRPLVATAGSGQ